MCSCSKKAKAQPKASERGQERDGVWQEKQGKAQADMQQTQMQDISRSESGQSQVGGKTEVRDPKIAGVGGAAEMREVERIKQTLALLR